ncbi:MAG: type II secretion system protein N [Gammaproteobacteria bacterium]|nr:type II secretion system protein N [Gammaproteobacteria bacterium]
MKKYIFLGVLVFLFAMVAYVPASVAGKLLPKNIIAEQFQGNVWDGSASSITINQINYGSIKWKIKPSCFLLIKICADIKQNHADITSSFLLKARSTTEIINLLISGNSQVLNPLLKNYGITLSGDFNGNMEKIKFDNQRIQHLQGNMKFTALDVNGVLRLSMGNVDCIFEPEKDYTQIKIDNKQGHIDLAGAIQLFNDMKYQLDIKVQKNSNSTEAVVNGLNFIGELQPDGSVRLEQRGSLAI